MICLITVYHPPVRNQCEMAVLNKHALRLTIMNEITTNMDHQFILHPSILHDIISIKMLHQSE